jgi:serine/threonine-protein kinase RsbW
MTGSAKTLQREVVLTVPFDMDELDTIRLTLYGVAVRMGFAYEAIEDLKVALTEACNYALLHHHEAGKDAALRIGFGMSTDELRVRLEALNCSLSFREAASGADELVAEAAEQDRPLFESGRLGLYMMQALVDEVRVVTPDDRPQATEAIELLKRLP